MKLPRFLKFLKRSPSKPVDPWDGSDGFYVAKYRTAIDEVAKKLYTATSSLHTCFNPKEKCAELHLSSGTVFARINVRGDFGAPYEAIIAAASLTDGAQRMIREIFPETIRVEFMPL